MLLIQKTATIIHPNTEHWYRYTTGVFLYNETAQYKGSIAGYIPNNPKDVERCVMFDFYAHNDADAYSHLLTAFLPDDKRRIKSIQSLKRARTGPWRRFHCPSCNKMVFSDVYIYDDTGPCCHQCQSPLKPFLLFDIHAVS